MRNLLQKVASETVLTFFNLVLRNCFIPQHKWYIFILTDLQP